MLMLKMLSKKKNRRKKKPRYIFDESNASCSKFKISKRHRLWEPKVIKTMRSKVHCRQKPMPKTCTTKIQSSRKPSSLWTEWSIKIPLTISRRIINTGKIYQTKWVIANVISIDDSSPISNL
jgi:hypothetical protein